MAWRLVRHRTQQFNGQEYGESITMHKGLPKNIPTKNASRSAGDSPISIFPPSARLHRSKIIRSLWPIFLTPNSDTEPLMNVLLAFDGSKSSVAALHDLAAAGLDADTRFLVVTVAEVWHPLEPESLEQDPLPEFIPTGLRSLHERSNRELSRAFQIADEGADLLRNSFPAATINAQAYADSPSLGILAQAEEWGAEMIVVGAQGRSMLGRLLLGSVSHKVLAEAHCPVRIGRAKPHRRSGPPRLLLGVDGSIGSERMVEMVASRRWPAGAEARIVSALDLYFPTVFPQQSEESEEWFAANHNRQRERMEEVAASVASRLQGVGFGTSIMVQEGSPKKMLLQEAERMDADTIFLGAKGVRGLERFLLGSVSSAVATRAGCSVEVIR